MSEPSGMPWHGEARPIHADASATVETARYRVIEKLESGGMAEVFRAESARGGAR
jgi:hypothetical protein